MLARAVSPMAEIESRLGIQPIEELLDQRYHLVEQVADLHARYGGFGTFDHLRKIELARIAALIRAQALRDGLKKLSNDEVDDRAHAHPDYVDFITAATMERARWYKLQTQISGIEMTINRGQAVARFATAERTL